LVCGHNNIELPKAHLQLERYKYGSLVQQDGRPQGQLALCNAAFWKPLEN
jgi:hypothetical protein